MAESIYLLGEDGNLRGMREQPYANEDLLQTLVERHPELLAGDQMNPESPRRWLLISREMAVPDEADGSARWSIDHLFVDQDAVPTLVEVKRSSDTRIRREVVGQMLDYAANGVVYWPAQMMRNQFDGICRSRNEEPGDVLSRFLGQDGDEKQEAFWRAVDSNLRSGRIRLVFLADQIPTELQRVVEFLNEQMARVDVIAVELKQFVGQGIQTLVPRLIGQTAAAKQKQEKETRSGRQWNEESFLSVLANNKGNDVATTAKRIIDWMRSNLDDFGWGTGANNTSAMGIIKCGGKVVKPFQIYSNGVMYVAFNTLETFFIFSDIKKRLGLREKLNAINGIAIPEDAMNKMPSFSLSVLQDEKSLDQFFGIFRWVVDEIKQG
ncbi:MAG: hypothetical protein H7835_15055 [Magnetococcus sp. XQGC-1]